MAITEGNRHQLYRRLEEVLGPEEATTLMEHLPPVGWADVATKTDLDHQRAATKSDLEQLRADTQHGFSQLSVDVDRRFADLRADMERGFREQTRTLVLANLGNLLAVAAVLLAALAL